MIEQVLSHISYSCASLKQEATQIANRLDLIISDRIKDGLYLSEQGLAIKYGAFAPIYADFSTMRFKEDKKHSIVRAIKPKKGLKVLDVTAGWGRDAAILAAAGAEVLMLERNPIMAAILQAALNRVSEVDRKKYRLSLLAVDAKSYLLHLNPADYPDVIYIDPMHPIRTKSSLVKKDMQLLQQIIGTDIDAEELVQIALTKARQKVVVKWPQKQPPIVPTSNFIPGKTIRFDLYQGNSSFFNTQGT